MVDKRSDPTAKRRLEALKRGGVHRIKGGDAMPTAVHVVGIGKAGAEFIAQVIRQAPDDFLADSRKRFTALAVDIGDRDLQPVLALASSLPGDKAQIRTLALDVPSHDELFKSLRRYREFLKLEFPRYYWNPNYEPWLPGTLNIPEAGEHFPRALAKALYGRAYYEGAKVMDQELELFTKSVDATQCQSVVCIVFGLGGGTGSGIVVDLARHLSNVKFGRRALVLGIGIEPCEGDSETHQSGALFATLNELDCMLDQEKNQGVVQVWGDLYRNPFTAGCLLVPQKTVWQATGDLSETQQQVDRELATFITGNQGTDLYETLRLLNWVGAPPTQHAAARSQYGLYWGHIFGFLHLNNETAPDISHLPNQLGLLTKTYQPDFFELRAFGPKSAAFDATLATLSSQMNQIFSPLVEPSVIQSNGYQEASVQFVLPGAKKTDLELFLQARSRYDELEWDEKLMAHSWLLELGVMLSEPAIRFEGMAGECLWGCACWVVVPYSAIRGEDLEGLREQLEQVVKV
jgi:hypothetical protein